MTKILIHTTYGFKGGKDVDLFNLLYLVDTPAAVQRQGRFREVVRS